MQPPCVWLGLVLRSLVMIQNTLSVPWHRRLCVEYSLLHIHVFNREVGVFGCKDKELLNLTPL